LIPSANSHRNIAAQETQIIPKSQALFRGTTLAKRTRMFLEKTIRPSPGALLRAKIGEKTAATEGKIHFGNPPRLCRGRANCLNAS